MTPLQFVKCMKYLCDCYLSDMDEDDIKIWYEYFDGISYTTLLQAIKEIVLESKFFPNAPTLKKKCIEVNKNRIFGVINLMKEDGYFKRGTYGDLSSEQELRNYDKTLMWLEKGIIPEFLKEDIKYYMNKYDKQIENKNRRQIDHV